MLEIVFIEYVVIADFFPENMVSVSSETNGIMNHSQLIQVRIWILCYCYYYY